MLQSGGSGSPERQDAKRQLHELAVRAAGIVLLSMACAVAVAAGWHSPIRAALAVLFLLVIPGLAVTELLEIDDLVYRLTIATGVSLAADSAVALALLYARAWSVGLALAILLAITAIMLAVALARTWRRQAGKLAR